MCDVEELWEESEMTGQDQCEHWKCLWKTARISFSSASAAPSHIQPKTSKKTLSRSTRQSQMKIYDSGSSVGAHLFSIFHTYHKNMWEEGHVQSLPLRWVCGFGFFFSPDKEAQSRRKWLRSRCVVRKLMRDNCDKSKTFCWLKKNWGLLKNNPKRLKVHVAVFDLWSLQPSFESQSLVLTENHMLSTTRVLLPLKDIPTLSVEWKLIYHDWLYLVMLHFLLPTVGGREKPAYRVFVQFTAKSVSLSRSLFQRLSPPPSLCVWTVCVCTHQFGSAKYHWD